MVAKKISELTELTTANNNDLFVVVDVANDTTKKITKSNLFTGIGSSYQEVNTYNDLPTTIGTPAVGSIYVVLQSTGIWLINRKEAGLWNRINNTGALSDWQRLGNQLEAFNATNFEVYDNSDNTKKIKLDLTGIATGTTRTYTTPNGSGTLALESYVDAGLATKEATVTAGTSSQYYRGDKTFQTLDKSAVGLGNVDNTSDAAKPISTATQTALNAKEATANKNQANGYCGLDANGKIAIAQGYNGATYVTIDTNTTIDETHLGKILQITASGITITIPLNLTHSLTGRPTFLIQPINASMPTLTAAGGVTLQNPLATTFVQYSITPVFQYDTNAWVLG